LHLHFLLSLIESPSRSLAVHFGIYLFVVPKPAGTRRNATRMKHDEPIFPTVRFGV
jgi:hypothetical protein